MMNLWGEWLDISSAMWGADAFETRKTWLMNAGYGEVKADEWAQTRWGDLPEAVQLDLAAEYEADVRGRDYEGMEDAI